jgi:hypothetical protein
MPKKSADITFNTEEIKKMLPELIDKAMAVLAFQVEGQTKVNIVDNNQVDTGFMLNSAYTVTKDKDNYNPTPKQGKSKRKGKSKKAPSQEQPRVMAEKVELPDGVSAAVAVGAEYAAYQEAKKSFLIKAAEQVAEQSRSGRIKIPMLDNGEKSE